MTQVESNHRVFCDRKFPSRLKGKFYRVAIDSVLLYETEYWLVKKTFKDEMDAKEIRMLRWM